MRTFSFVIIVVIVIVCFVFSVDTGISEKGNGEVIIMESMHQRKKFMSEKV